jgi:hypothetical protein
MIEFLKNIIPRIQKYSKGLDKIEVFVDKTEPWIYIDENGGQHQYIFLREGKRLIMISNGITKVGKWELLPTNQLLIDRISDIITLDHLFVEKALLILKRSGTDDLPFVLISREEIPDLDVEGYLEKFEREKETISIPQADIKYKILKSGKISGPVFYEGLKILTDNGDILSGTYNTTYLDSSQFVKIENNVIVKIFYKIIYTYNGQKFQIEQGEFAAPQKGDILLNFSYPKYPMNELFEIHNTSNISFKILCDQNGKLIKVEDDAWKDYSPFIIVLVAFILLLIMQANGCLS